MVSNFQNNLQMIEFKKCILDDEIKMSLLNFFNSTKVLTENKIIRSSKYSADIAEFLCAKFYDLELSQSQREVGFDAFDKKGNKIQIKINNSSKKTNQNIGIKTQYDYLYLVITSKSLLFNPIYGNAFLSIYKIHTSEIIGEKYISKTFLRKLTPDLLINRNFEKIEYIHP